MEIDTLSICDFILNMRHVLCGWQLHAALLFCPIHHLAKLGESCKQTNSGEIYVAHT